MVLAAILRIESAGALTRIKLAPLTPRASVHPPISADMGGWSRERCSAGDAQLDDLSSVLELGYVGPAPASRCSSHWAS